MLDALLTSFREVGDLEFLLLGFDEGKDSLESRELVGSFLIKNESKLDEAEYLEKKKGAYGGLLIEVGGSVSDNHVTPPPDGAGGLLPDPAHLQGPILESFVGIRELELEREAHKRVREEGKEGCRSARCRMVILGWTRGVVGARGEAPTYSLQHGVVKKLGVGLEVGNPVLGLFLGRGLEVLLITFSRLEEDNRLPKDRGNQGSRTKDHLRSYI